MALSKTQRDWLCCNTINTFLFDKVWNEPFSEYRINVQPMLVKQQSCVGSFSTYDSNIALPTDNNPYYIWAISAENFQTGLQFPTLEWTSLESICNDYNTLIHMYGATGIMFHKASTFLMYNLSRQLIFIAAKKRMVKTMISPKDLSQVYLTFYYDSDKANPVKCLSVMLDHIKKEQELQMKVDEFLGLVKKDCHLQVYRDGYEYTDIDNKPMVQVGEYLDILIDENIDFTFDIDLPSKSQAPVYFSSKDKTWKQLVHIPKKLNPDNKVITKNTCDFVARKRYFADPRGLYIHRASYGRGITQVTHNDMSIPLFAVDYYRDALESQEIYLHCIVRTHGKDNTLIRDADYIDLLYSEHHDDDTIKDILCGKGPKQIPWWTAESLEYSKYIAMMFDTPNLATTAHMRDYVKALGFYQVVNLLCKRILDTTITDAYTGTLKYHLPILYTGMKVVPVVYLNGWPIERKYISYFCDTSEDTIDISISKEIYTKPGDKLTVILFVDGDRSIYTFTPTKECMSVELPFDDVIVHYAVDTPRCKGVTHQSEKYYQFCPNGSNFYVKQKTDTGVKLTFGESFIGCDFHLQCAYTSIIQSYNLDKFTKDGSTISILAEARIVHSTESAPILNFKNVSLFLNGHYLVRGIDYFIHTVTEKETGTNQVCFHEVVIQTMDYFEPGRENILDVIYNVAEIEDISNGFSIHNRLQDETPVNLYFPNLSAVHVDGKLRRDLTYRGTYMLLQQDPESTGGIFEIQTSVPRIVHDFVGEYAPNEEIERIKILNEYFYPLVQQGMAPYLVLEGKHRLYSIFLNNFIRDICTGKLDIVADPDENRMMKQINPYLRLKEIDLCFKGLDQRFVDYYPQYVNYEVTPALKLVIDKYIQKYMPKNIDPTLEVVYEQR